MTVTFCGHAQFYGNTETRRWLVGVAEALISEGADTFLLGGYGGFDSFAHEKKPLENRGFPRA